MTRVMRTTREQWIECVPGRVQTTVEGRIWVLVGATLLPRGPLSPRMLFGTALWVELTEDEAQEYGRTGALPPGVAVERRDATAQPCALVRYVLEGDGGLRVVYSSHVEWPPPGLGASTREVALIGTLGRALDQAAEARAAATRRADLARQVASLQADLDAAGDQAAARDAALRAAEVRQQECAARAAALEVALQGTVPRADHERVVAELTARARGFEAGQQEAARARDGLAMRAAGLECDLRRARARRRPAEAPRGTTLCAWPAAGSPVTALAFAPRGDSFVAGLADGRLIRGAPVDGGSAPVGRVDTSVLALAVSAEGWIAVASGSAVVLFDPDGGETRRHATGRVRAIGFVGDDVVVADYDALRLLGGADGAPRELRWVRPEVAAVSPSGTWAAVAVSCPSEAPAIHLFESGSGGRVADLPAHGRWSGRNYDMSGDLVEGEWNVEVCSIAVSERLVASAGVEDGLVVVSSTAGNALGAVQVAPGRRTAVAIAGEEVLALALDGSGALRSWSTEHDTQLVLSDPEAQGLAVAPDDRAVAVFGKAGVQLVAL